MAFVNEKIDGKWQTIDRERGAVLSKVSGPDIEGMYNCELVFNEAVIKFSGYSGMKIHGKPEVGEKRQYEMNWKIFRLFIPENLQDQKEKIIMLITDALEAYGDNYNKEKAASVSVQFTPNLI